MLDYLALLSTRYPMLADVNWWQGIGIALLVVGIMEVVAIVSHKYVMHGFLWVLHKSHHEPRTGQFERNDWFGVAGAIPSMILLMIGTHYGLHMITAIGAGITMYGAIYFFLHDILVHRRVKHSWNPQWGYMKRVVQAHRLHHVVETKHGTVSFGFIWAPPIRKLKAQLEADGRGRIRASAKMKAEMGMIDNAEHWAR
ncbi:sterol desaturase family protein [Sandarakinorhabdus limnophila]|uniref:sterol desaturase family protein n=1 Tax=Sandarakinorhabdus limnophila TaxID=210512 RepID=UPI0003B63416|nr:sterol desaturase family protein [Sandarakinorhabdus limnophila]